tara:strand:+ start:759 stop:1223 length:465 start_codon:yes stop_codon:yes gene_type:complete
MITVTGMADLRKKLAAGNLVVIEASREAVTDITEQVALKSQNLVPFDTGALARSMVIKYPIIKSDNPKGEIAYGGVAAPYAVVQHELEDLYHPPKPPGKRKVSKKSGSGPTSPGTGRPKGSPKYLQHPLEQIGPRGFQKHLLKLINKYIRIYSR